MSPNKTDEIESIERPDTYFKIGQYNYTWKKLGIRVSVDRLDDDGPGEMSVYHDSGGQPRLLYWGKINLLSVQ